MYRIKLKYDDGHYRVTNSPTLCLSHALLHEFEREAENKGQRITEIEIHHIGKKHNERKYR